MSCDRHHHDHHPDHHHGHHPDHHHDHHDGDHHHHHHCPDKHAVIRNPKSGLVLDARDYEVKLHHHSGHDHQLWKLEPVCDGRFVIVNKANGKALDIQGGSHKGAKVITYDKHGGENQQWYVNSDRTIVSAGHNLALDIYRRHFHDGNHIVAWPKHGWDNQHFVIEYE